MIIRSVRNLHSSDWDSILWRCHCNAKHPFKLDLQVDKVNTESKNKSRFLKVSLSFLSKWWSFNFIRHKHKKLKFPVIYNLYWQYLQLMFPFLKSSLLGNNEFSLLRPSIASLSVLIFLFSDDQTVQSLVWKSGHIKGLSKLCYIVLHRVTYYMVAVVDTDDDSK